MFELGLNTKHFLLQRHFLLEKYSLCKEELVDSLISKTTIEF